MANRGVAVDLEPVGVDLAALHNYAIFTILG